MLLIYNTYCCLRQMAKDNRSDKWYGLAQFIASNQENSLFLNNNATVLFILLVDLRGVFLRNRSR